MSTKPPWKWTGGKRQLLPEIRKLVPPFRRYFEPFVGGGALFFDLEPSLASLSDTNPRLISAYIGVRDDVESVIRLLKTYPYDKSFYEQMRNEDPGEWSHDPARVAAWFIYLNKTCFNGLYRVNKKGQFNVPFGRPSKAGGAPLICDEPTLREASRALQKVDIQLGDFERVVADAKSGDFVYMDCPYIPLSATSNFTGYTSEGFNDVDQVRLRNLAVRLHEAGVKVLLSNSSAPAAQILYANVPFRVIEVGATRSINSAGDKRGKVKELLIATY